MAERGPKRSHAARIAADTDGEIRLLAKAIDPDHLDNWELSLAATTSDLHTTKLTIREPYLCSRKAWRELLISESNPTLYFSRETTLEASVAYCTLSHGNIGNTLCDISCRFSRRKFCSALALLLDDL